MTLVFTRLYMMFFGNVFAESETSVPQLIGFIYVLNEASLVFFLLFVVVYLLIIMFLIYCVDFV